MSTPPAPANLPCSCSPSTTPVAAWLLAHDLASSFQRELRPLGETHSKACPCTPRFHSFPLTSSCPCAFPLHSQPPIFASPRHTHTHTHTHTLSLSLSCEYSGPSALVWSSFTSPPSQLFILQHISLAKAPPSQDTPIPHVHQHTNTQSPLHPKFTFSYSFQLGFPCGSAGKESTRNVGDLGSIPGLGRFLGEGKGYHSSILAWRIPWTV